MKVEASGDVTEVTEVSDGGLVERVAAFDADFTADDDELSTKMIQ